MTDDEVTALLIEDNPADAFLVEKLSTGGRAAVKLTHAKRLEDGLALLRGASFDAVLLDLTLPDAEGAASVARTYAVRRDVPIIVLTGNTYEELAIQAMKAGAQDYLIKGEFDGPLLLRSILYARERKRAEVATQRLVREQAARVSAEAAERSARFLADASRALASSLDPEEALTALARITVPTMADGCLVDLGGRDGRMRRVGALAAERGDPDAWCGDLEATSAAGGDPVAAVMRTGEPVDFPALTRDLAQGLRLPPGGTHLLGRGTTVAPMIARGRTVGTLTLIGWLPDRLQGTLSLLALELAGRAALAVDNARLYRAREVLLEVVSRDLRVPLNTILASLPPAGSTRPAKSALDTLSRTTNQMSYMVEDLLDMGRLERGTFALEREPVDLCALLLEVAESFRAGAELRGLRLEVGAPEGLPHVQADRRRLTQVLWNLMGGSLHHTPSGGKLEVRAEDAGGELQVEIGNDGPSIGKALQHLFDRRWQDVSDLQGMGVGLAVARAIVEAHGGRMGAAGSAGNRIFFSLPTGAS